MDHERREALAAELLASGVLRAEPGAETPLRWIAGGPPEAEELRLRLIEDLAELVREHYSAAEAVLGDGWAEALGRTLGLPAVRDALPERPLLILGSTGELETYLPLLTACRRAGGSPAIAVVYNGREEELRRTLDRADIRCHWLTDLESAAAAALQSGLLDFDDYCRLLPQP